MANSTQLGATSTEERRHLALATHYVLPLKKRPDVQPIRLLRRRKVRRVLRNSIKIIRYTAKYNKANNVETKLFDLLIPKAIAVVEMDAPEASVLKLFDQSIVSCEFVNELRPHLRRLHREDSSVFPLRFDSDDVPPFQKRSLQVFGQPKPIHF